MKILIKDGAIITKNKLVTDKRRMEQSQGPRLTPTQPPAF